ncbi:hypothetical protein MIND_00096000 [Mycena indigotica]|uniref:BTB domain-containing protein n=1 Tax=Mycena indigotica TaxID=2126181 RepID=A0A8H6TEI5_9AGAR|nr:uncharacterized protein MIND_00096000 [Mycena indigotica]KAF7315799.1 hypothetical protein MIND_00096000 [Mycena indigotica]
MAANAEVQVYHPLFSLDSQDSNVVYVTLRSKETPATYFSVPPFVLRRTSGYFFGVLDPTRVDNFPIPLDEPAPLLVLALSILCGLVPTSKEDKEHCDLKNLDTVESLFDLSQRWDAPALASRVRDAISSLPLAENADPIRSYALATRAGWGQLARDAARRTLVLPLFNFEDEKVQKQLHGLSTTALLRLFAFHRKRRDSLDQMLRGKARENEALVVLDQELVVGRCKKCGEVQATARGLWIEYCSRISVEMDVRPLGDKVVGLAADAWNEALACWSAECGGPNCPGEKTFDREKILLEIQRCISTLPDDFE